MDRKILKRLIATHLIVLAIGIVAGSEYWRLPEYLQGALAGFAAAVIVLVFVAGTAIGELG